eukprot:gene1567-950_t
MSAEGATTRSVMEEKTRNCHRVRDRLSSSIMFVGPNGAQRYQYINSFYRLAGHQCGHRPKQVGCDGLPMYAEGSLPSSDRQHLAILYWRAVFTPESDDHSGAFTRRRTKLTECILRASYAVQHLPVEPTGAATERCPVSFSVLSSVPQTKLHTTYTAKQSLAHPTEIKIEEKTKKKQERSSERHESGRVP